MEQRASKRARVDGKGGGDRPAAPATPNPVSPISARFLQAAVQDGLQRACTSAKPYAHCVLSELADHDFMAKVKEEVLSLQATYKETDLFKVNQTPDLANLDLNPEAAKQLPHLQQLRDALYTPEFRGFISHITQCGPLTNKTDMAGNVYAPGCHLLAHDDVIGTRRVSYIIYLSDDGWGEDDGGALELFPVDVALGRALAEAGDEGGEGGKDGKGEEMKLPSPVPTTTHLPLFNCMGLFEVVPGVSVHSVQEVYSPNKRRVTIQGWFHAEKEPEGASFASLSQVKSLSRRLKGAFAPLPSPLPPVSASSLNALASLGISPQYTRPATLHSVHQAFLAQGSVHLHRFLQPELAARILQLVCERDEADGVCRLGARDYRAGEDRAWEVVGPPHIQRFMRLKPEGSGEGEEGKEREEGKEGKEGNEGKKEDLEARLGALREQLFQSPEFAAYISAVTGLPLEPKVRAVARRFRPGLDYTVATAPDDFVCVDVSLCFVDDRDGCDPVRLANGTHASKQEAWESGECGGFECYIKAEEESNPEVVAVYSASGQDGPRRKNKGGEDEEEEEEEEEEAGVINVDAVCNALSVVVRKPDTMRFVKFVSAFAPSSRVEVFGEFVVDVQAME